MLETMHARDQYRGDPTHVVLLAAMQERPGVREFLKQSSFDGDAGALPSRAFAWESERLFPVHTPEDTVASVLYRAKCAHVPPEVDEKLQQAITAYQIPADVFRAAQTKQASAPEEIEYAVPSQQRLPLGDAAQIKVAEEVLLRDKHALPFEQRAEAFARLGRAAARAGVKVAGLVEAYAAGAACDTRELAGQIELRAGLCKQAACAEAYDALSQAVSALPYHVYDAPSLLKIASRLHELDGVAGLEAYYDRKIADPMAAVFNQYGRLKAASAEEVVDLAGVAVPLDVLMALPDAVWDQLDASEIKDIIATGDRAQARMAIQTLPRDMLVVLAKQLG